MNTISIICQVLGVVMGLLMIGLFAHLILEAKRENKNKGRKKDDGN